MAEKTARSSDRVYDRLGNKPVQIQTDSATIHFRRLGQGPTLMLVHGFGPLPGVQWQKVVQELAEDFDLIVPDMIFFGKSSSVHRSYSPQFQANQLVKALNQMGVEELYVCGLSYGGMVSNLMAADEPGTFKGLILVDALNRFYQRSHADSLAQAHGEASMASLLLPESGKQMKKMLRITFYKKPIYPAFLLNRPVKVLFADPAGHKMGMYNYLADNQAILKGLELNYSGPIQIIWGEHDHLIPLKNAYQLLDYYQGNSDLEVIPKAGHAPNVEKAKQVAGVIKDFIQSNQIEQPSF